MTTILDGKKLSEKILADLKEKTSKLAKKPKLAVILVGNNPASEIYVRNKSLKAQSIGFESLVIKLDADISEENLLEHIFILNEDVNINAILVQLPLPEHINKKRIIEAIEPIKDVDGFTAYNFGRMALGYNPFAVPCTPKGIIRLLDEYNIELEGKNALVIGRSNIVGRPLALMLEKRNATVTIAHSRTKDIKTMAKQADILISAIGKPKFITKDFIKDGAVVVDVGISRDGEGISGDVDFENVSPETSYITPVPGGVGPMTIAMLMENTYELYKYQTEFQLN